MSPDCPLARSLTNRPTDQPGITYRDTNRRKWNFLPSRRQAGQPDDGLIDVAGLAVRQPLYTGMDASERASEQALAHARTHARMHTLC